MIYQRIRYFLQAAACGSFSRAAGQMYVSAQALTKQIGLLEEEIGGKLFQRTPHGVTLTRLGEYALERFDKIDQDMKDTIAELKFRAGDNKEHVNIGIFSALPKELVTPLISLMLSTFPNYQIGLNLIRLHEGRKLLTEGKIDILLTNTHEEDDWSGYRCLSFGEYDARVIVSLLHPWAIREKITEDDMRRETFLKMTMGHGHYRVPEKDSFYSNIPCRDVQEVVNFDTMYALLQQGEAFAVFPMAFADMDRARIRSFAYPGRRFVYHTALIYNPDSSLSGLDSIVQEIVEEFDLKEFSAT